MPLPADALCALFIQSHLSRPALRQPDADTSVPRSRYAQVVPLGDSLQLRERDTGVVSSPRAPGIAAPLSDVIAVVVVVACGLLPFPDETSRAHGHMLVVALLPAAVMPFRRRWPIAALGVSLACAVALAFAGVLAPGALVAVAITAFSMTDRMRRLVGISAVGVAAVTIFLTNAVALDGEFFDSRAMQYVLFILLAGALGDAARSRREYASAMRERAERAEKGREEEARRRVAEERVRIARDLHDVVAHQISVISLSAGVASSSLESRPDRARDALTSIRSASRTVLSDIGALMALLRAGAGERQDYLHPQAGLGQLDELFSGFVDAGLRIDLDRASTDTPLSPANDHVAYLALREGLTNAHKHGAGGWVAVRFFSADGVMHLVVSNPVRENQTAGSPSGHGLRGLRERVAAVGGGVDTALDDGHFRLDVWVPADEGALR